MSVHVEHLNEDHIAWNRSHRQQCADGKLTPAECEDLCYDQIPADTQK